MKTFKIYLILTLLLSAAQVKAQFKSIDVNVSGLTCSMCSFATEKALRTLDFVQNVQPDLNTNLFVITFKPGKTVSIDMIKDKVKSAGFSVYKLEAVFSFNNLKISNNYLFSYEGNQYEFLNVGDKTLNGDVKMAFIDKDFVPEDQYKKMLKDSKYKDLAANDKIGSEKIYHVTL